MEYRAIENQPYVYELTTGTIPNSRWETGSRICITAGPTTESNVGFGRRILFFDAYGDDAITAPRPDPIDSSQNRHHQLHNLELHARKSPTPKQLAVQPPAWNGKAVEIENFLDAKPGAAERSLQS